MSASTSASTTPAVYTVRELAQRFRVKRNTILTWIKGGDLQALNVAPKPGGKPAWRITSSALEQFERSRQHTPPTKTPRKARRQQPGDVVQFYA